MVWKPKVTVAAVIKQGCKVLIIEERTLLFNQPVDHLESNQSLQEAEVLEESAYEFKPQYLISIFRWHAFVHSTTYLPFAGHVHAHYLERTLDADLIRSI